MKNLTATDYQKLFDETMELFRIQGITKLYTDDKEQSIDLTKSKEWKQAYQEGDAYRSSLPMYWFVSDQGDVISFGRTSNRAQVLKKDYWEGYVRYHIDNKIVRVHNLVGIIYGSEQYGKAKEYLKEEGIYAFGNKGYKEKVNGHHIREQEDNTADNVEMVSTRVHTLLESEPGRREFYNDKDNIEFMQNLGHLCSEEEPYNISVFDPGMKVNKKTGEVKDINYQKITTAVGNKPSRFDFILDQISKAMGESLLIESVIDALKQSYGQEFFKQGRILSVGDETFVRVTLKDDRLVYNTIWEEDARDCPIISCGIDQEGHPVYFER